MKRFCTMLFLMMAVGCHAQILQKGIKINYGLNSFDIINYNDIGVCRTCIEIILNNPYTLEEVMSLLPVHPFCRCLCVIHNTTMDVPLEEIENPIIIDMFN